MKIYKTVGYTPESKSHEVDICFWGEGDNGKFAMSETIDGLGNPEIEFLHDVDVDKVIYMGDFSIQIKELRSEKHI